MNNKFYSRMHIPFLFRGPTAGRFYAIAGDYWTVESSGEKKQTVRLLKKSLKWWHHAIYHVLVPGGILVFGAILQVKTGKDGIFVLCVLPALAAGLPMLYIQRKELEYLNTKADELFVVTSDGTIMVDGKPVFIDQSSSFHFEYTFHPPSDAQGDSGHSEFDFVIRDDSGNESRYELLSHKGNWLLRKAKKLSSKAGIDLKRVRAVK